ncbi:enolase C-terminal domain-like protein [Burkholderia dolosa]|uniref:enolase C-terminal domain-like protein n=1 Tax=Burkholderia dolosa TaxID=152500 RepID=UPI0027D33993|nr:enolase C-terminal domain-like protein [Burkholderia dolosa]
MRILDIREQAIPVSRYDDPAIASGGLTTSIVAIVTDVVRDGRPVTGYGYASVGRFAQGGLIRERFAPRLLAAAEALADDAGTNLDPLRAWRAMMAGEKPGGHGERCVAVGTLDMAIWDAAAKIARVPLHRLIADRLGRAAPPRTARVRVYAGGGYRYPRDDLARLSDEMRRIVDLGYTHAKIKIGTTDLDVDRRRIEAAAARLADSAHLAVDAMNAYDATNAGDAAAMFAPFGLWWFEDVCDPLDLPLHVQIAAQYAPPIAAGEALFSLAEAKLLDRYGGLRSDRDVLVFDPVHCYGLSGYLQIVDHFVSRGWRRDAFWPHGGHLFSLHVVAALGLGGAEVNPFAFHPFSGLADGECVDAGYAALPSAPGIGFECHARAHAAFRALSVR